MITVVTFAVQGPENLNPAIALLFVVIGRFTIPLYFIALGELNPGMV